MRCLVAIVTSTAIVVLSGCAPESGALQSVVVPAPVELAQPDVVMEADPAPPFTYWAPEGSTIHNHPRDPQIWIAQSAGQQDRYYFGDQCQASRYQNYVGRPVDQMPDAPEGAEWRTHCSTCPVHHDLARARMNIGYDDDTRTIVQIACG